jgi:imipenem/basic amino acid-specific outer membrane pore
MLSSRMLVAPLCWLACGGLANADPASDAATLKVLARNFYLDTDNHGAQGADNREWAQGFIARFESAFTPGLLGVGVDAHGFAGFRLDSGSGRSGTGLLPVGDDGRAATDYSDAGLALKLRAGDTRLSLGEMEVETPVFDTADKRLQPEYASGALLQGVVQGYAWSAGRFHAFRNQNETSSDSDFDGYGASTRGASISFAGLRSPASEPWGGALYAGSLSDTWNQLYLNLHQRLDFASERSLGWALDAYRTRDAGRAKAGDIDTLAWSLSGTLTLGAQAFAFGYQKIHGDTPFDFVGGDSIYLANAIKYADFNGPNERSLQARYDLDLATLLPGLTFMARYVRGSDIDGTHAPLDGAYTRFDPLLQQRLPAQGKGGKHWERDLDLAYRVASGKAAGTLLHFTYVSHRANAAQAGRDIDRIYLVIEYPFELMH